MNAKKAVEKKGLEYVTVSEAAELVRVSEVTIRRYLGLKRLKRHKFGTRTLLNRADVLGLVHEG
jgi:excisionase family DNA binding protein